MNSIFISLFVILALANGDGIRSLLQRQMLFSAQAADNAGPGWIVNSLPSLDTSIATRLIEHYLPSLYCKQRTTTQRSKSKSAMKSYVFVLTSGDGNHLLLQGHGVLLPAQTAAVITNVLPARTAGHIRWLDCFYWLLVVVLLFASRIFASRIFACVISGALLCAP